ncbi:TIGR02444 family protein [Methylobacterium planeticum]|uniref:TIGR02444 family protein n=1 Tax=Methylobacterium planeticum TaxID=2615211 RepID=A0A6N6MTR4_9HYPH|nr:TIGR02444 family protein [Methylobacterium planeticum]KAB1073730.1 TIGR02444 family protein [Methylobacterium planeticum]
MTGDPLWTFACAFYGRPGIAEACLALQDEADVDVALLLYLIWCAQTGRPVDAAAIVRAEARAAPWRAQVIAPLRAVRRAMRSELLPGQPTQALRERIKAVELEAERLALAALSAAAPSPTGPAGSGGDALALYSAHLGRPWPDAPLQMLRATLGPD